jgi:hypothetical protein
VHFVDNTFTFLPPFLLGADAASALSQAQSQLFGLFDLLQQPHHDDMCSTAYPALGFAWSSVPFVSASLKQARFPVVKALVHILTTQHSISYATVRSAKGLFVWIATIFPLFAAYLPVFKALEALTHGHVLTAVEWFDQACPGLTPPPFPATGRAPAPRHRPSSPSRRAPAL